MEGRVVVVVVVLVVQVSCNEWEVPYWKEGLRIPSLVAEVDHAYITELSAQAALRCQPNRSEVTKRLPCGQKGIRYKIYNTHICISIYIS